MKTVVSDLGLYLCLNRLQFAVDQLDFAPHGPVGLLETGQMPLCLITILLHSLKLLNSSQVLLDSRQITFWGFKSLHSNHKLEHLPTMVTV